MRFALGLTKQKSPVVGLCSQDTLHYTRILQKKLCVAALVLGAVPRFRFKKGCVMVYFM